MCKELAVEVESSNVALEEVVNMEKRTEESQYGSRSIGVFWGIVSLAGTVCIFCFWHSWIAFFPAAALAWFGIDSLRIALFGSKKLIDRMCQPDYRPGEDGELD